MLTNSKKIATKLLQRSDRLYLCNKFLNLHINFKDRNTTDFNDQIRIRYLDHRKFENLKYLQQQDSKNQITEQQIEQQSNLVSENMQIIQDWIKYDKLVDKNLTLQSACNTLYLMCQYNIQDQKVEEKVLDTLNQKGIENLSLSNLLDIKTFLKANPSSILFKLHSKVEDLIHQKSKLYENVVFLQLNGNSTINYEYETELGFFDRLVDSIQDRLGLRYFTSQKENQLMHESEMRRLRESNDEIQEAQTTQLQEQHEEEHDLQIKQKEEAQVTKMKNTTEKKNSKSKNQQFKLNNK